jgi:hypothetical protein
MTVLRRIVVFEPLLSARSVEDLAVDALVVQHCLHLVGVTEILCDKHDVKPREIEIVISSVLEVRPHTLVLPNRRHHNANVLTHFDV